jgi:hypothetical protein
MGTRLFGLSHFFISFLYFEAMAIAAVQHAGRTMPCTKAQRLNGRD